VGYTGGIIVDEYAQYPRDTLLVASHERNLSHTMPMRVILLQEVPHLGKPGDINTVADGYARNYLLPRQMVEPATPRALANLEHRVATEVARQQQMRAELAALAERLQATTLTFAVRVGTQNRLYGSVTNQNIVEALREQEGIVLDRRSVVLNDPLRQIGEFKVPVRLGSGFEPQVTVQLTAAEK
jgi:large subunit ribosomal protein L9